MLCLIGALSVADAPRAAESDELLDLRLARQPVPLTRPREDPRPAAKIPNLPADGSRTNGHVATLVKERRGGWFLLKFESSAGKTPEPDRRVLPCRLLESMEAIAKKDPAVKFRVWGETTVHGRRCYFLPQLPTSVSIATGSATTGPTTGQGAQPTSTPTTGKAPPRAADVLTELLRGSPARPIVPRIDATEPSSGRAVARGRVLVDRLVRVLPEEGSNWKLLRFESDNTLQEPPIRLLQCNMLAVAETFARTTRTLRVTGEVHHYKGKQYVLLRKVLRQRQLGRF